MRNYTDTLAIIKRASNWKAHQNSFVAYIIANDNYGTFQVTDEELAQIDSRLPILMHAPIGDIQMEEGCFRISHKIINETIAYWNSHQYLLKDPYGRSFIFASLNEVREYEDYGLTFLRVTGDMYNTHISVVTIDGESVVIKYADMKVQNTIDVSKSWMDMHYPEWEERWATLETLDVSPTDRPSFLFTNNAILDVPVSELPTDLGPEYSK